MLISVITPSYNQGRYIERTIQSVLNQDFFNLEYIVMDGESNDATLQILQRYQDRLTFISEKDQGQADAVNKGLKKAKGEIIGWLNSDDIYYPGVLKKIAEYFAAHPEIDVVYGDANHIDQQDQIINQYPTEKWNIERLKQTCYLCQPAVFFRRRVFEKYGYLNTKLNFCLDYEYWLRLALAGAQFGYLPEILAGSRLYPETKTMSSPLQAQREALEMLSTHLGMVPLEWIITYAVTSARISAGLNNKKSNLIAKSRFLIWVAFGSWYEVFRWNGWWQGLKAIYELPLALIKKRRLALV